MYSLEIDGIVEKESKVMYFILNLELITDVSTSEFEFDISAQLAFLDFKEEILSQPCKIDKQKLNQHCLPLNFCCDLTLIFCYYRVRTYPVFHMGLTKNL